ncbi:hypothetical protein MMC34_005031 [Xylographa carneopallida]|nr:hypothetical protein [Xylographa carneopallida]
MLDISKVQEDQDVDVATLEFSKQKNRAKLSMASNAVEKIGLDDKFPLFTQSLEESSVAVQPRPAVQAQPKAQPAISAEAHLRQAVIETAKKEAKAALKSSKKHKWTPEQKRQRREQRALQGGNETPRRRSAYSKQVALGRDSSIDGGVSLNPKPSPTDAAKSKSNTSTLPIRSVRKSSFNDKIVSASQGTLEEKMASAEAAQHLSKIITNLNSNAPVYRPTRASPLGSLYTPPNQNSQAFVPYQPVRFASAAATRNPFQSSTIARSTASLSQAKRDAKPDIPKQVSIANPFRSPSRKDPKLQRGAPKPTTAYLEQSSLPPRALSKPGDLLLVLDINGTLLCRKKQTTIIYRRPSLEEFLSYCLKNHSVLVWSSSQPENVDMMCSKVFSKAERSQLIAEWGRDTLELSSAEYYHKTQVYKRLDRIWKNERVQVHHPRYNQGERWSQRNTVLIDDSMLKAVAQPFNHIEVPEFELKNGKHNDGDGTEVLGQVVAYLEEIRAWEDVSSYMRKERFVLDGGYRWDWATGRRVCPDSREDL